MLSIVDWILLLVVTAPTGISMRIIASIERPNAKQWAHQSRLNIVYPPVVQGTARGTATQIIAWQRKTAIAESKTFKLLITVITSIRWPGSLESSLDTVVICTWESLNVTVAVGSAVAKKELLLPCSCDYMAKTCQICARMACMSALHACMHHRYVYWNFCVKGSKGKSVHYLP